MSATVELVGKIGSMALIDKRNNNIDYNLFARLSRELRPGMIWVSSGATEIGRIDYINRAGRELAGAEEDVKADYSAQGQAILMQTYRRFVPDGVSLRQVLVEHQHFNEPEKADYLRRLLLRAVSQGAVPIVNYNDAVSSAENRKNEIQLLAQDHEKVVECVDNDETAAQIACLVGAKLLLILTSTDGIYADPANPASLIPEISGGDIVELFESIDRFKASCVGSSRKGANGARAKLEYIKEPLRGGASVIIANAQYPVRDILSGLAPATRVGLKRA